MQSETVIFVDFSESEPTDKVVSKTVTKESEKQSKRTNVKPSTPPSTKPETQPAKAKKIKTFVKNKLQRSQKPKAESSKVLEEKLQPVKKVISSSNAEPTKEERAHQEATKRKNTQKSLFGSLLSKSKNTATATDNDNEEPSSAKASTTVESKPSTRSTTNKNIKGVLGNRKVLKVPTIVDTSQKKGRVVVKICVNKEGQVMSSQYTMIGSTTNDSYLIGLAEKGAKEYLFTPSSTPKECGNVSIEFKLK